MDLTEEVSKRKELCGIIEDLSKEKNEESLNSLCSKLQNLYCDGSGKKFRHFYSDISSVLRAVHEDNKGGLDAIVTNLEKIKNMLSERDGNFYETLNKLIDHVCLEALRIKSSEKIAEGVCSNKEELKRSSERLLEELRRNYDDLNQKTGNLEEKFKDKTDGIQKQFVAVLGVFASIIMVCNGGFSFTNATLSAIGNANIFKLIAVSLTVGLVLIDVCHGLFYCLDHFMNSNDRSEKFKPLLKINVILLAVILCFALCAVWYNRYASEFIVEYLKFTPPPPS